MPTKKTIQVRGVQPRVDEILSSRRGYPIFGTSLHTHLESFAIDSGIAYPLQLCINRWSVHEPGVISDDDNQCYTMYSFLM